MLMLILLLPVYILTFDKAVKRRFLPREEETKLQNPWRRMRLETQPTLSLNLWQIWNLSLHILSNVKEKTSPAKLF